jgi:hypothetical protein
MHNIFAFMLLQYAFTTFSRYGFPSFHSGFNKEDQLDYWSSQGGLGARLMLNTLTFVLSHEYAHGTS